MEYNKKIAFTLVELIVVITILAILGTIAFINLQGYSVGARDSKRLSDINNLQKKIAVELVKGESLGNLINLVKTNNGLIIDNNSATSIQGTANFQTLKENGASFKDPITKGDYVLSYSVGGSGTGSYEFIQISTINEELNQAVVKGNYYQIQVGDSPSMVVSELDYYVVDGGVDLPYEIVTGGLVYTCDDTSRPIDNGYITYVTGTPTSTNQAYVQDALNCGYSCTDGYTGSSCEIAPILNAYIESRNTCETTTITVGSYEIASCNVGATSTDPLNVSSYGYLFQWGNALHHLANNSSVTLTNTLMDTSSCAPNNCKTVAFVTSGGSPYDWSSPQNSNLWGGNNTNIATPGIQAKLEQQGVCPDGFHIPTQAEWNSVITTLNLGSNGNALRDSILKIPYAGDRHRSDGSFGNGSSRGFYWSSSPIDTYGYYLFFESSNIAPTYTSYRAYGFSVRCFKN